MSNQIVITSGAKLRDLDDVIIGTDGILSSVAFNVANGVPRLDENGKILVSQLPNSVMEFKGVWNAATNSPTLVNGTGNAGDVWLCNVAGTVNFGAGPIVFAVGDYAVYTGSVWARSSGATGTVTSVGVSRDGNALTITGSPVTSSGTINLGFSGDNTQYINGAGNLTTFPTVINSIGLTMPAAFNVSNSPLTANGTIGVSAAGYASQYIRGDGTLADFPSSGGGGSSVSYYFNGGTSQGTIGGTTYYEMSKTADTGTGVDFNKTGDGFIVAFLTDANDPNLLQIPAGNWDFEIYASMSANGGTPELYAELYKYDGTTFTLIATSSHEILYDGVNLNLYSFATAVPQTSLTVTDRLAIKLYADNSGGKTTTIHTQDSHLCQVITTFSTGLTALNGLTAQVQYFGTGTSGNDFNIVSSVATHTFNIPSASATARGLITTGTQTIAGSKTITGTTTFTGGPILSDTNLTYANSGFTLVLQSPTLSVNRTVTLPNGTGTLALISDLSGYVDLTTDQTIGGTKTFSNATKNNGGILLQNGSSYSASGYMNLGGMTNGLRFTSGLGISNYFALPSATGYTYTFPSATGTVALTSDLTGGTVTSVGLSAPTGFSVSGSPVTTSGTLALSFASGYSLPTNVKQSNWDDAYTWVAAFPTQTGNNGKFLTTDGSSLSWAANPLGTVTSVAMSVPTGLTVSGSPITTSGTLAVTLTAGYSIPTTANQSTWSTAYNRSLTSAAVTGTTTKTLTLNQQDGGTITASWTDINTDAVTSVFGRTGAVVATEGDYTLTQLGDVTITTPSSGQVLKYNGTAWINDTDANTGTVTSVAMTVPTGLSIAGSPITSSGTLAVTFASGYSIPTNASQTTWDTAYTNRITSLTTTGSSGSSTLVSNTLNIPTYTLSGLGGQPLATNLTSLSGLTYASISFVKMTASGTFALDTNTYLTTTSAASTYLPLSGGTLTGPLGGTSANFLITSSNTQLKLGYDSSYSYGMGRSSADGLFYFQVSGAGASGYVFQSSLSGTSATFSGSMAIGSASTSAVGLTLRNGSGASKTAYVTLIGTNASSTDTTWYSGVNVFSTDGSFEIKNAAGNGFKLDTNAAATFSSSISTTSTMGSGQGVENAYLGNGFLGYYNAASSPKYIKLSDDSSTINAIQFSKSGAVATVFFPSGSVAIGGANDGAGTLYVNALTSTNAARLRNNDSAYSTLDVLNSGTGWGMYIVANKNYISGNVLIGTTTDSGYKLNVNGVGSFAGSGTVTGTVYIQAGHQWSLNADQSGGGSPAFAGSGFYIKDENTAVIALGFNTGGTATFASQVNAESFYTNDTRYISNQIMSGYNANSEDSDIWINYTGYQGGTTRFRDFRVGNGKQGQIAFFDGSAGTVTFYGSVTATSFFESSDSRLKTLIQDNYQTKGIGEITPKLYTKNGKVELGYYAQDFIGVLDSAISKGSDDMLSLSYREVHTAKIYALEQEIKQLKAKLN